LAGETPLDESEIAPMETEHRRSETGRPILRRALPWLLLLPLICAALTPAPAAKAGADLARLTYTRVLKGSVPEYIGVTVNSDGTGSYDGRQLSDPPSPQPFKLSAATTQRIFALAAELHDFQSVDLESHKKVANLGRKTFTYEKDGQKFSAEFNYTVRREAQDLADLFEKIASVEEHIQTLEFSMKYDHLGLPAELLRIQIDLDNKALAEPELMVPTLEEIARDPRFLHLAQVRAQAILQRVQNAN
jgi:hypothetical protein